MEWNGKKRVVNLSEHNQTGLIGDLIVDHGVRYGRSRRIFFIGLVTVVATVAVPVDNSASIQVQSSQSVKLGKLGKLWSIKLFLS